MASPVFYAPAKDAALEAAYRAARESFRFFWREQAWERRRIIGGLTVAAIKVAFHDPPDTQVVEHMWLGEIEFDGVEIAGRLLNNPNQLRSVAAGAIVELKPDGLNDWMYAIGDKVYGGFTIDAMRQAMSDAERAQHDEAWGLDFGAVGEVELVPADFYKDAALEQPSAAALTSVEHPMARNMREKLAEALASDPSMAEATDELGFTMLHRQALAGDAGGVSVLLASGADKDAKTARGQTALDLATSLGWIETVAVLRG